MRLLVIHNTYRGPGGEDEVARMEAELLRSRKHEVLEYWRSNSEMSGVTGTIRAPLQVVWARDTSRQLKCLISSFRPDIIHVHNSWMVISPVVYWVAQKHAIPVVQTLHNYRLLCSNGLFLRKGKPCETCKTKTFAYPGVLRRCYRSSALQSLLSGGAVAAHRMLGTWHHKVDVYIALTDFARRKFIEGGLPADRIVTKPNFLYPDPGASELSGDYVLFIGRLSQEKGVMLMLEAWKQLKDIPLKVAGDGPLMDKVGRVAGDNSAVELLGWQPREKIVTLLRRARFLVFPSLWYEGFPMTIAQAFACSIPIIASRLGALAEIVEDGVSGLHFSPGDPEDLVAKVRWAWSNSAALAALGRNARSVYETRYTAEQNYAALMHIYQKALRGHRTSQVSG